MIQNLKNKTGVSMGMSLGLSFIVALFFLASCMGGAPTEGGAEALALHYVKSQLGRTAELTEHEVLTASLPAELNADAFKSYRDAVNKARLDYSSCQVRGIQQGMDKALATIASCQDAAKVLADQLAQSDTASHIIVLATLKEKSGMTSHLVAAFNPETLDMECWQPITTPVQNNAILITNAQHGTLLDYAMAPAQNLDSLAATVADPVVQFILRSNPK